MYVHFHSFVDSLGSICVANALSTKRAEMHLRTARLNRPAVVVERLQKVRKGSNRRGLVETIQWLSGETHKTKDDASSSSSQFCFRHRFEL